MRDLSKSQRGSFQRRFSQRSSLGRRSLEQEHADALTAFKQRIHDAGLQPPAALFVNKDVDATLLRFLRARKYNVDHALAMLEKSCLWRTKVGADTILEQPLDVALTGTVRACRPSSYIGFDREHHPIFVERLGKLDGKRMEREGVSDQAILNYHLREMEFMAQVVFEEASAAAGHTVDRVVSVMDASGLSLSALTGFAQRLFRLITAMDSDNYPECCHAIYIVNAGATFTAIWRILAPFVDKGTRDKVHVIANARQAEKALSEAIGPELVPSFLGGQLDYEAVRQHWMDKMDAAMQRRRQNPKGQLPPVLIQAPHTNGHLAQQHSHTDHLHHHPPGSASGGSALMHLIHRLSSGHHTPTATSEDGFATPRSQGSVASRLSSVASVYYDAQEPPSPYGESPRSSSSDGAGGGAPHPPASPFHSTVLSSAGAADSMSVGPQSRTRSQLSQQSGFTTATVGLAGTSGGGTEHPAHHLALDEEGPAEPMQPGCACRCTIM